MELTGFLRFPDIQLAEIRRRWALAPAVSLLATVGVMLWLVNWIVLGDQGREQRRLEHELLALQDALQGQLLTNAAHLPQVWMAHSVNAHWLHERPGSAASTQEHAVPRLDGFIAEAERLGLTVHSVLPVSPDTPEPEQDVSAGPGPAEKSSVHGTMLAFDFSGTVLQAARFVSVHSADRSFVDQAVLRRLKYEPGAGKILKPAGQLQLVMEFAPSARQQAMIADGLPASKQDAGVVGDIQRGGNRWNLVVNVKGQWQLEPIDDSEEHNRAVKQ